MYRKLFFLRILITIYALLFSFAFISCGSKTSPPEENQTPNTTSTTETSKQEGQPYYFWKAEKQGKVSYWLGTIHIGVSIYDLPCKHIILQKIADSDLSFFELVDNQASQNQTQMVLSPGSADFKQLSPESQTFLSQKGIPDNLNYIGYLSVLDLMCIRDGAGASALQVMMDKEVQQNAEIENVPLKSLDTPDLINSLISSITKEDVEKKIEKYPQCPAKIEDFFYRYKQGELSFTEDEWTKGLSEQGLRDRNQKWIETFKSVYDNYNHIFVAVGVAHLIGPFNLVDMLKKEGFSVEQMSCL